MRTIEKALWLLSAQEKRRGAIVLVIVITSAFASSAMIGVIFPFLSVLVDAEKASDYPWIQHAYDYLNLSGYISFVNAVGILAIMVILAATCLQIIRVVAVSRFTMMRIHSISSRLFNEYLAQDFESITRSNSSEMSSKMLTETGQVVQRFFRPLFDLITAMFTVTFVAIVLFIINTIVASVLVAVLAIFYGVVFAVSKGFMNRIGSRRAQMNAARYRVAGEALNAIAELRVLGKDRVYQKRFSRPSREMARTQVQSTIVATVPLYITQLIVFGGIVLAGILFGQGQGDAIIDFVPVAGVFLLAGQRMIPEMSKMYQAVSQIAFGKAALNLVFNDLHSFRQKEREIRASTPPISVTQKLELQNVSHRFRGSDADSISSVSLTIRKGERIGIIGPTGAGKTTLINLILGLLSPTAGVIRVDDEEIMRTNVRRWRSSVGYVPQQIFLSDASIIHNVALGEAPDEIDPARVEKALRMAQLWEFAISLPRGLDTPVGQRGARMSGGQRQRLGIARALYFKRNFLVFDEATSALDNETESRLVTALNSLSENTTQIMIAHRLSTIENCDKVVFIRSGRIVAEGPFKDLMQTNQAFADFVGQRVS